LGDDGAFVELSCKMMFPGFSSLDQIALVSTSTENHLIVIVQIVGFVLSAEGLWIKIHLSWLKGNPEIAAK